jgi:hypothetical protein
MRFFVKVSFPVEAGNAAAKKNGFKIIQKILKQQQPEAAYFIADVALNASIEATPAMVAEDLAKAAPAIEQAVKSFG